MTANGRGWRAYGRAALVAVLAVGTAAAAHGDAPPKGAASELDLVPADGGAVISVRFADLWNHAALKAARDRMAKEAPDLPELFTKQLGVSPDEVDRIMAFCPSPAQPTWAVFVTTLKPYDTKEVAAVLAPDGKEEKVGDRTVVGGPGRTALAFLTDRTYVFGNGAVVLQIARRPAGGKDGPLTPALREAAGNHLVVAGLDGEALAGAAYGAAATYDLPPDAGVYQQLRKATNAVLTVDLGDEVRADLRVAFAGEAEAKEGEEAMNAAADLFRAALVRALENMRMAPEWTGGRAGVVALMKEVQAGLRTARLGRNDSMNDSRVEASASLKIHAETTGSALLDAVQEARIVIAGRQSVHNLRMLAVAIQNYHDTIGHLPTNICDKSGKPLLSWRVAILPYIEQQQIYNQFHLDEPWDSEHNKKLFENMPKLYGAPLQDKEELNQRLTRYQGFAGPGAVFGVKDGVTLAQISAADGTSITILLAEAARGVPWSKPDDIPFDEGKLAPKVGGLFPGVFHVAMVDGSVHTVPLTIKEDLLRALITWNGGEAVAIPER